MTGGPQIPSTTVDGFWCSETIVSYTSNRVWKSRHFLGLVLSEMAI